MNYRKAIDWLFGTQMFGIKLGLDATRHLLREFRAEPAAGVHVIHVAGTNGKGSTCAMIESIARAADRSCGLFTSPHLIDYRERIQIAGVTIPQDACATLLTGLRDLCERMDPHPTFFEISLVLAMRWFREHPCELIVLETGMGGRFDATTAVPADVCVITPVAMDHMQYLGESLAAIAMEKAGIFVPGKPAVSAPQEIEVTEVLEKEANRICAPLEFVKEPLLDHPIALTGTHQQWNAALAVAALTRTCLPLDPAHVRDGLARVNWPGRFEEIRPGVVLDGAHNPQSAKVLAETWQARFPGQGASLVFSAVAAKDIGGILEHLAPIATRIFLCPVTTPRVVPPEELATCLPAKAPPHEIHTDFQTAFAAAQAHASPVLVAGSLFLAGEARAFLTDSRFQSSMQ
jgi:dihydrofolate synthase/folylpolyglutamate synthase